MKEIIILAAAGAVALLAGCGGASSAIHRPASSSPAAAPATPSPSPSPSVNTTQEVSVCKDVRRWLPGAWSQDPPQLNARLTAYANGSQQTALQTDLSALDTNLFNLSPGGYMGTSTGITPVRRDCAALGVKITLPTVAPDARCRHRFRTWQDGPVQYEIDSMSNALGSFTKYSNSNIAVAVTFLKIAGTAAGLAKHWPMPSCADPGGYWHTYLKGIQATGRDAGSPSLDAALGYLPQTAISDEQNAQSAFHSLRSELTQSIQRHPFG